MTEETSPQAAPASAATPKRSRRPKPGPGRHGTGEASAAAIDAAPLPPCDPAPTTSPRPAAKVSRAPAVDTLFGLAQAAAAKPASGGALTRKPAARVPAKTAREVLSLEDTIAVAVALVALRADFTIVHIETSGADPLRDEILSLHAMRVERRKPVAEFNSRVQPLRAPGGPVVGRDEAGRPPAKRQPSIPLEEAMAGLCRFLGTHRQHVFVHDAASTQTRLGQAARQYGVAIENPVGDLIELAKLAWPDRSDYSLAGMAVDLLHGSAPIRTAADASRAILGLLEASSKLLTANGGRVSRSIVHWGTSPDTFTFKPSPW